MLLHYLKIYLEPQLIKSIRVDLASFYICNDYITTWADTVSFANMLLSGLIKRHRHILSIVQNLIFAISNVIWLLRQQRQLDLKNICSR